MDGNVEALLIKSKIATFYTLDESKKRHGVIDVRNKRRN